MSKLWNFLPVECFPLSYDLGGLKSRINRHLFNCRFFLNIFSVCWNLFCASFLVTPCLVVAVQPCMEWISIFFKKKALSMWNILTISTEINYKQYTETSLQDSVGGNHSRDTLRKFQTKDFCFHLKSVLSEANFSEKWKGHFKTKEKKYKTTVRVQISAQHILSIHIQ